MSIVTNIRNNGQLTVVTVVGVRGPQGGTGGGGNAPAISADPENRAHLGTDGGVFVPEMKADLLAYYIVAMG